MKSYNLPRYLKLCRVGNSLHLTVPHAYVDAHNLSVHDYVLWQPEPDGIKLTFGDPSDHEPATHEREDASCPS